MRHPSFEASCGVCNMIAGPDAPASIFEDELWHVRSAAPAGVPGWMMMVARRHVAGPAQFDDREAADFGPALRHFSRVLLDVTGALRIYVAAMGEAHPHFHAHLVPRYREMPREAKGWSVFDLQRAVGAGEVPIDAAEVARLVAAFRDALVARPR